LHLSAQNDRVSVTVGESGPFRRYSI
jgi:hypothetical protein